MFKKKIVFLIFQIYCIGALAQGKKMIEIDTLKVAAVQLPLLEAKTSQDLLNQVSGYLLEAQKNSAQLVVFPELIATELVDWSKGTEKTQLAEVAKNFTPQYIEWLTNQSKKLSLYILGGTAPRVVNGKIYNTAILTTPEGKVFLQDKLFLTPDEKKWGWSPGTELIIFEMPWGKVAITTCFDAEFVAVSQLLTKAKPHLILVPSWTSSASGLNRVDWTSRSRAVEHYAYVIKTGTVPAPQGTQTHFGRASIITPQDQGFPTETIEGVLNQPSIIYGNLNFKLLKEKRKTSGYYPDNEQDIRTEPLKVSF